MKDEIEILEILATGEADWPYKVKFKRGHTVLGWNLYGCTDELEAYRRAISGEWNFKTKKETRGFVRANGYQGEVGWEWIE